MVMVHTLG
jgi:hypothetical protein